MPIACVLACATSSTTSFEQVWRAGPQRGSVQTVATLYESEDGALRRTVEDLLARKLRQRSMRAVPAYTVLAPADLADRTRAKAALLARGIDGVIAVRLIGTQTYPTQPIESTWAGTWPVVYEDYTFASPIVRLETTLYSVRDETLLWSGRTKTVEPDSVDEVIDEVTSLVVATLPSQGAVIATARR